MPPSPLACQIFQPLRHLGPADGIGGVADSIGTPVLPAKDVQPDHQLHVLPHGVECVTPRLDDHALFEQAEGAGDDDAAVEFIQHDPGGQEGAVVLQHLHTGQEV